MSKPLIAYSDGGADVNPGLAGWAFYVEGEVKVCGYYEEATNNEMELKAMIELLKYLTKARKAIIFSDSTYVVKGLTEWIHGWRRRNWMTTSGTPVANKELWEELASLYNPSMHELKHVKGHSGVEGNEICDSLVQQAKFNKWERHEDFLRKLPEATDPDSVINLISDFETLYAGLSDYDKRKISSQLKTKLSLILYKVTEDGK